VLLIDSADEIVRRSVTTAEMPTGRVDPRAGRVKIFVNYGGSVGVENSTKLFVSAGKLMRCDTANLHYKLALAVFNSQCFILHFAYYSSARPCQVYKT